ncbi:MAG: hypothetical protein AABY10_01840 [Nanoarchaeota archaeon]
MSSDYAFPGKRKTKRDKKAKARYNRYKKGGSQRASKITISNKN